MPKLIMTVGLPASGKTTWAKQLVLDNPGEYKRVNKDDLRSMLDAGHWSKQNEAGIIQARDLLVRHFLGMRWNVIVDDTNFAPKHAEALAGIASEYEAEFIRKDFDTPLAECIKRDAARENPVGKKVIMQMYNQYLKKPYKAPTIDPSLPAAIICDIDGTLAHMGNRSPFDWARVGEDVADESVGEILNALRHTHVILLVSGRDECCREQTARWLYHNNISFEGLFMRPAGNNEDDRIIKKAIYNDHIKGKFNVLFVLDDRDKVVEMWREEGLKCLQVAPGDF